MNYLDTKTHSTYRVRVTAVSSQHIYYPQLSPAITLYGKLLIKFRLTWMAYFEIQEEKNKMSFALMNLNAIFSDAYTQSIGTPSFRVADTIVDRKGAR
jgi:hypothetical protein